MTNPYGFNPQPLKAPFPYFGGKSGAAGLIWQRFGNPRNYVEPFAGSLAVLLARPHEPKIETVNDLDGLLSNAWRAIRLCPDEVALHADQPVVEVDLTARHRALVTARADLTERLIADPDYCDPKLAGWWIWGASNWIGGGWCAGRHFAKMPRLGDAGSGVSKSSITRLPRLGNAGTGVNRRSVKDAENGVHAWMRTLSLRLRRVRITCGSWERVTSPAVTVKHGITAVLLDPPYNAENATNDVYAPAYSADVATDALAWAVEHGDDPHFRIAYCGYDLEPPPGWVAVRWKANKGYQKTKGDLHNGYREVILFSPHCLRPDNRLLFTADYL